jgi:hypothetical protein
MMILDVSSEVDFGCARFMMIISPYSIYRNKKKFVID